MDNYILSSQTEPTAESFHLGRARQAYIDGAIDLDRFEELVEVVLVGGYLSQDFEPRFHMEWNKEHGKL
jgi:hypothetical protein